MRTPTYLSYSSMALFENDIEEFYIRYLADNRPAKLPQLPPMAVGSAFDAFVKATLYHALFGSNDPKFEFGAIFESQVEPQNRDFCLRAGKHAWKAYKLSGAYDDLLACLQESVESPRFEFSVTGTFAGAPFLGKPDCLFALDRGEGRFRVILDWKCKGHCSKYAASPSKGYAICRDGYVADKPSRSHGKEHNNYLACNHHGLTINQGYLEDCNCEYADQLTLYGWLMGEKPGDENVVCWIEEIVAKPTGDLPLLRVATHRARVRAEYQLQLLGRVGACWDAITSGHIFQDMTREESESRCNLLDQMAIGLATNGSFQEDWFSEVTRPQYKR